MQVFAVVSQRGVAAESQSKLDTHSTHLPAEQTGSPGGALRVRRAGLGVHVERERARGRRVRCVVVDDDVRERAVRDEAADLAAAGARVDEQRALGLGRT